MFFAHVERDRTAEQVDIAIITMLRKFTEINGRSYVQEYFIAFVIEVDYSSSCPDEDESSA